MSKEYPKYSMVIAWSDEDQMFVALSPEFDGISTFGNTPEQAVKAIQVALQLAVDTLKEEGLSVPAPHKIGDYEKKMKQIHDKLDKLEIDIKNMDDRIKALNIIQAIN